MLSVLGRLIKPKRTSNKVLIMATDLNLSEHLKGNGDIRENRLIQHGNFQIPFVRKDQNNRL